MGEISRVEKKIKRKKLGLLVVLLLLISSTFFILLSRTSLFNVSRINVEGNEVLESDKVVMASGIIEGENIFKVDLKQIEANLLYHPYIRQAKVKRVIPNKISIKLIERSEIAVITHIGSYIYIDNEGVVLNILSIKKDSNLLEVSGVDIEQVNIGDKIVLKSQFTLEELIDFVDLCDKAALKDDIERLEIDDNFNIILKMKYGTEVAFGDLYNVKYKLSYLIEILEHLKEIDLLDAYIDFTNGDNPIIDTELD